MFTRANRFAHLAAIDRTDSIITLPGFATNTNNSDEKSIR